MRGYWKVKEEALDRILWRTHFGSGYGPVIRQTSWWWWWWRRRRLWWYLTIYKGLVQHVKNCASVNPMTEVRAATIFVLLVVVS